MTLSPRSADAIRKVVGYLLATVITVLIFRVLSRTAQGTQSLLDLELFSLLLLATLALLWVRAARRIRRSQSPNTGPRDDGELPPNQI